MKFLCGGLPKSDQIIGQVWRLMDWTSVKTSAEYGVIKYVLVHWVAPTFATTIGIESWESSSLSIIAIWVLLNIRDLWHLGWFGPHWFPAPGNVWSSNLKLNQTDWTRSDRFRTLLFASRVSPRTRSHSYRLSDSGVKCVFNPAKIYKPKIYFKILSVVWVTGGLPSCVW